MTKLKIGFYGITGCAGCQLSVIFNEDELLSLVDLIDIRAFPFIKEMNKENDFDFIFLEGLVANKEDLDTLKRLRGKTKKLVAFGACAHTGSIPAYRHFTLKKNYTHLIHKKRKKIQDSDPVPIDSYVKVDYTIPGCPPDKNEVLTFIKDIVKGKEPRPYNNPVCVECRRNNNVCLLDLKKPCLGPITRGGCNSVCTNNKLECWGCRGLTDDADIKLLIKLLKKKGHSKKIIKQRMRSFVGLKIPDLENLK